MKRNNKGSQLHGEIKGIQGLIDNMGNELFTIETELPQDSKVPAILRFSLRIRRIQQLLDMIGTRIDRIDCSLTNGNITIGNPPPRQETTHSLKQAHDLQISFEDKGSASVSINGLVPFQVPPVPAYLLQILAIDTGNTSALFANDPLVPFKSFDEIISHMMNFAGGRKYTKDAARTGVFRLRRIMAQQGFHKLIQTNRRLGAYRFALRRKDNSTLAA